MVAVDVQPLARRVRPLRAAQVVESILRNRHGLFERDKIVHIIRMKEKRPLVTLLFAHVFKHKRFLSYSTHHEPQTPRF